MYNALTPLFDHVTNADLFSDFKSEQFGLGGDGPGTIEPVPFPGVTIMRDRFHVPHVTATTHAGGVWAAGWIAAEDRGLLLQEARDNSYVAAIDVPGLTAIGLIENLQNFQPSAQTEQVVARQTQVLQKAGPEGRDVLSDIDEFITGINAYLKINSPTTPTWTRNDIYALNALKDQFFGEGGGREAQDSEFLGGLEHRLGVKKGYSVFNDLRQNLNAGSPTTVDGTFNYDHTPSKPGAPGSVVLDPGSFHATPAVSAAKAAKFGRLEPRPHASNELMVEGKYSTTGHPLLVGGPQVGYFYPGLTYEIDMHAPGLDWRGATSAPFPGYMLIGRGPDFATTLTSASGDVVDEFAETLCGHSKTKYLFNGKCRSMENFDAGTLAGKTVAYKTTVHGPVVGYARVHHRLVAISSKRSSYGKDVLDLLFNRRLSDGQVHSPQSFFKAAELTPQTFNSFYIDDKHVAEITTGLLPLRPKGTDPSLPTIGTGKCEWRGFAPDSVHPKGIDPLAHAGEGDDDQLEQRRRPRVRRGRRCVERQRLGRARLAAQLQPGAAAQARQVVPGHRHLGDERLRDAGRPGDPHRAGAPGAAQGHQGPQRAGGEDAVAAGGLAQGRRQPAGPQRGRQDRQPRRGDHERGVAQDRRRLHATGAGAARGRVQLAVERVRLASGRPVQRLVSVLRPRHPQAAEIKQPQPFANAYCGAGNLRRCRQSVWAAIAAAGKALARQQHSANPGAWRASATDERITFIPGLLRTRWPTPTGRAASSR